MLDKNRNTMSIVAMLKEYCQGTCQYISNIDSPGVYGVCVYVCVCVCKYFQTVGCLNPGMQNP